MSMSRHLRLLVLLLGVLAMAGSALYARAGLSALAAARQEAVTTNRLQHESEQQMAQLQQRSQLLDAADQLMLKARQLRLQPTNWVERRINLRLSGAARHEVDHVLQETMTTANRLFVVESFELSTASGGAGLFNRPGKDEQGVNLTLRGSFFARDGNHPIVKLVEQQ